MAIGMREMVEQLEGRRLLAAHPLAVEMGALGGNATSGLHVRAAAKPGFVGSYLGTAKIPHQAAVAFSFTITLYDTGSKFILGAISFPPVGRVPFSGTYKTAGGGFSYSQAKPTTSLKLTGKLGAKGNTITGKFTLVAEGGTYTGKYALTRQA